MPTRNHRQGGSRRLPPDQLRPDFPAWRHDDGRDPDAEPAARTSASASGLVRWGAFTCVLVPLTLLVCGVRFFTVLGTAAGLTVVTAACGVLLRLSEYAHAQRGPERFGAGGPGSHRGRHSRTGTGLHRGGRYWGTPGQS
ncbi:hypothetical protein [Streptomyces sp. WMMB 322]|uniref:hypothetical protein n=1 Tax=Streptomyces sp. WMMB 322 TaxID=1286821 RepID=UPI000823F3EA|nr:hypothetical protein [Streptomyces sp. WMMB 322]SCK19775.1 hypothetical protein H180DRAFT_01418 [Streptomyces sp. WMMB 322]